MAKQAPDGDFTNIIGAARLWVDNCLVGDGSALGDSDIWTSANVARLKTAFIDHPDLGDDDFLTKLHGQLSDEPPAVRHLAAEMLWAMYLFPSNIRPQTKRTKILAVWGDADTPSGEHELLSDSILGSVGSAGPGL